MSRKTSNDTWVHRVYNLLLAIPTHKEPLALRDIYERFPNSNSKTINMSLWLLWTNGFIEVVGSTEFSTKMFTQYIPSTRVFDYSTIKESRDSIRSVSATKIAKESTSAIKQSSPPSENTPTLSNNADDIVNIIENHMSYAEVRRLVERLQKIGLIN